MSWRDWALVRGARRWTRRDVRALDRRMQEDGFLTPDRVRDLLRQGASPNGQGRQPSPLNSALLNGLHAAAEILIAAGAKRGGRNDFSQRLEVGLFNDEEIQRTVADFNEAARERLLDRALTENWLNPDSIVALRLKAARFGANRLLPLLLDARTPPPSRHDLQHLLTYADGVSTARILIAAGADPDTPDTHHAYPLFRAAEQGDEDLARVLMEGGARPHRPGTPRSWITAAVSGGSLMLLDRFIREATPDAVAEANAEHEPPLHWAVRCAQPALVSRLLADGPTWSVPQPESGDTPFHVLATTRAASVAVFQQLFHALREHGLDPTQPNRQGAAPDGRQLPVGLRAAWEELLLDVQLPETAPGTDTPKARTPRARL